MPDLELNNTVLTRPHHRTHAGPGESGPQPHTPSHPIPFSTYLNVILQRMPIYVGGLVLRITVQVRGPE